MPVFGGWHAMGWMAVNSLFWLLLVVLAVFLIVRIMRPAGDKQVTESARAILEERYAKGEIPRDEYLQKKKDILSRDPA
jgi:putative membrane protein